jgi:uncharacterized protein
MELNKQIINEISQSLSLKPWQTENVLILLNEGCTIPFIARYRKEKTGNLDEVFIYNIKESYDRLLEVEKRRDYILQYLESNGLLIPELSEKLKMAKTLPELEDIYLPFKPRKKTLADKARELGMEPLAVLIKEKNLSRIDALKISKNYFNENVNDQEACLNHALDIIVQEVSDSFDTRKYIRNNLKTGTVNSSVKRGKKESGQKYQDYFDFREPLEKMASHRVMALLRAEKEGIVSLAIEPTIEKEKFIKSISRICFQKNGELLDEAALLSYERHLAKSLTNDILKEAKEKADLTSLEVFAKNLEKIILAAPFGEKSVIGIDPGIRTGCKAVALDPAGRFLAYDTVNLSRNEKEIHKLAPWLKKYDIRGIVIGSGTFGRETFAIVKKWLKDSKLVIALIDEDGASIYSASEAAREEFPELDVTVKGSISIGRRFQNPMAELVKIEPKSLGVGQYQHDINATLLKERLTQTVEWAVNKVGVNLNTTSYHLLSYISGLDKKKAREIIQHRDQQKKFSSLMELKKVKGIGEKAFEQAAGFLRILDGENILDATGVHPESYNDIKKIAEFLGKHIADLVSNPDLIDKKNILEKLKIEQIDSIVNELKLKGLDPRDEFSQIDYNDDIKSIEDLTEGLLLNGKVDNVVAFGAFIDLGIKDKGLLHISQISHDFVTDINSVLSVGQTVKVKVIEIDKERKRISLTMKDI